MFISAVSKIGSLSNKAIVIDHVYLFTVYADTR